MSRRVLAGTIVGLALLAAAGPIVAQPAKRTSYWWAARPLVGEPDNPENQGFAIVLLDSSTPQQNRQLCEFFQKSPAFEEPFKPDYEVAGRRYFRRPIYWPLKPGTAAMLGPSPTCEALQAHYDYATYAPMLSVLGRPGAGPFITVFSSQADKNEDQPKYRALYDFSGLNPAETLENLRGFVSYFKQDVKTWRYAKVVNLSLTQRAKRFPAKVGSVFTNLPWGN